MRAAENPSVAAERMRSARRRRTATGVWRWRNSPLCRGSDLVEAWAALAAVLLIVLAAPVAGLVVGLRTNASLQHAARVQHQERHPTTGVVLGPLRERRADGEARTATAYAGPVGVLARWTAHDGTRHTGRATTLNRAADPGDTFPMWTDGRGRIVNRPLDASTAAAQSALTGLGAAATVAGLAHCARLLVVRRLMQRRYERLDRAWAKAGPEWGRTGAGG